MKQRHGFWLLFVTGVLLVASAIVVACAPDTSAPELQEPAAPTVPADASADLPVAANADDGAAIASVAFTDTACLDCHADAERLKELAVEPEEPEESLSSGPG